MPKTKYRHQNVIRHPKPGDKNRAPAQRRINETLKALKLAVNIEERITEDFDSYEEGLAWWLIELGELEKRPETYGVEAMFQVIETLYHPPSIETWMTARAILIKYPGWAKDRQR